MLNIDLIIMDGLQWMKSPVMDKIMVFITSLGDNAMIWIILALILLVKKRYRMLGVFILLALGVGFLIGNLALKNMIGRSRPSWDNDTITLLIANPKDFSFPSGHTMHSFIAATMIALQDRRKGILALILAGAIAFSRVYLYVHYPTDIVGGAVLGIFIGVMMTLFYRGWEKRKVKI